MQEGGGIFSKRKSGIPAKYLCTNFRRSNPPVLPKLFECALTFQFEDGSPVDRAGVSLIPEDSALAHWSISGATDSSGVARIYTSGDFPGASAGKYKVLVRKQESVATGGTDEYGEPNTELRQLLKAQYNTPAGTPFSLEISDKAVQETFKVEK